MAHAAEPRVSQVLPTVKCSSCSLLVPFASLGDHACPPAPSRSRSSSQKTARDAAPHRVRTPSNTARPVPLSPPPPSLTLSVHFADPPARPPPRPAPAPLPRDNPPPQQPLPSPRSPFTNVTPVPPRPSFKPPSVPPSRPSLGPHHTAGNPPSLPIARSSKTSPASSIVPFPVFSSSLSARRPPPPPLSLVPSRTHGLDREIDTKTGGEAGMAGVGRRGFAAVARAAMLTTPRPPPGDALRANIPRYLDGHTALGHVMRAAMTPPSSPNSAQTSSPVSPFPASPVSFGDSTNGQYPRLPSPHDAMPQQPPRTTSNDKAPVPPFSPGVRIASPSRSPSPIPNPFERRLSGETITQSPMPGDGLPLPFIDVLKPELDLGSGSDDESVYTSHTDPKKDENTPLSPSADSDVGLAYAHSSDDDTPVVMPLDIRKSTTSRNRGGHPLRPSRQTSVASLRSATSASSSFTGPLHSRSTSAATQSTAKSTGALARAMETLIEEGASVSVLASGSVLASIGGPASSRNTGKPSRSNTVPGPTSPEQKPPKLPTRSHTSPSHPHVHSERVGITAEVARIRNRGSTKRKDRICAGCDSKIEDGRWIPMDGGSVLCERCWKNMYLPKCRRCNLPIEKQAVSSRDGQLKGKYHKDCFNCHVCQKPFPDKEFYVFDGKPFCAYHYHEANNSLCGASSCGQPIEGPCAVTHSGKRYHPEHLLCECENGCKERLEEYWEVDGQMLCERHAALLGSRDSGWARSNDPAGGTQITKAPVADEGRVMKRMTRFIDLGAGGVNWTSGNVP